MLTNNLKRLIFYARSIKKTSTIPVNQTIQNSNKSNKAKASLQQIQSLLNIKNDFQKNKSDTLTKEQIEKQKKLQKDYNQLMNVMSKGANSREQIDTIARQQKFKRQIQNLQLPKEFQSLYLGMKKYENEKNDHFDQNIEQKAQFINASAKQKQILKRMLFQKQQDPAKQSIKLKQEAILDYIQKNSSQKEIDVNLPANARRQLQIQKQKNKQYQEYMNQQLRYEKLKQITENQKNKSFSNKKQRNNNSLSLRDKVIKIEEPSIDEKWRSQYSPQIVEQALNYKNTQLRYFKDLVQGNKRDKMDYIRQSTWLDPLKGEKRKYDKSKMIKYDESPNIKPYEPQQTQQKIEKGLARFKDNQYYIEKGVKQFQESQNLKEYDRQLQQEGFKDLIKGNKLSQVFMETTLDPQEGRITKAEIYQASSFGKYQTKLKKMSSKLVDMGIDHDFEDLAILSKQQLFAQKNIRQQDARYQQYLLKKQKKKQMKQELKKIHKQKLRDDLNFQNQTDRVQIDPKDPLQLQATIEQMDQSNRAREATIVSGEQIKSQIHYKKTFLKMSNFINGYFYNDFANFHNQVKERIQIGTIIPNKKNTVLNVFWKFNSTHLENMKDHNFSKQDIKKEKQIIQQKLQRQKGYISGKMTQLMGLRYGPDIRFHFEQKLQQTNELIRQMKKYKKQIVELALDDYREKGLIKTQQDEQLYRQKLKSLGDHNINELNNRKKLLKPKYRKQLKEKEKLQQRLQRKMKKTKQRKGNSNMRIMQTDRQKDDKLLDSILGQKTRERKAKVFSAEQDQYDLFGIIRNKKTENVQSIQDSLKKKKKMHPAKKLWNDIDQL